LALMDLHVHPLDGGEIAEALDHAVELDQGGCTHLSLHISKRQADLSHARRAGVPRRISSTWARMTSVIDTANTMVPIALMRGLTCPCKKPSTLTGSVSFRPDTNQATANSSKE